MTRVTGIMMGLLVGIASIDSPVAGSAGLQPVREGVLPLGQEEDRRRQLADRVVSVLRRSGDWGDAERPLLESVREGLVTAPITIADGAIDSIATRLDLLLGLGDAEMPPVFGHDSDLFFGPLRKAIASGAGEDVVRGYGTQIAGRIAAAATVRPLSPARVEQMRDMVGSVIDFAYEGLRTEMLASEFGAEYLPTVDLWLEGVHRHWAVVLGTPLIPEYARLRPRSEIAGDQGEDLLDDFDRMSLEMAFGTVATELNEQAEWHQMDSNHDFPRPHEVMGCVWNAAVRLNSGIGVQIGPWFLKSPLGTEAAAVRRHFVTKGGKEIREAEQRRLEEAMVSDPSLGDWLKVKAQARRERESQPSAFGDFNTVEHLMRSGGFQWLDGVVIVPDKVGTPLDEDEPVIRP